MPKIVTSTFFAIALVALPVFARGGGGHGGGHGRGATHSSGASHSSGGAHHSTHAPKTQHITHTTSGTTSGDTVHVHSYTKKDGTTVTKHDRTGANTTKSDNWSTKGNVNPVTGKPGTKKP